MSKIAIFLANGFEEIEGLTVVDICRRCGLTIDMVSITEDRQVMGSHKIPVTADMTLSQVDFTQYDCLVLPGGGLGTKNLEACEPLMQQVDAFYAAGKYIAAMQGRIRNAQNEKERETLQSALEAGAEALLNSTEQGR